MLTAHNQIQTRFLVPPTNSPILHQFTNTVDAIVARDFPTIITEATLNGYCKTFNASSKKDDENAGMTRYFEMSMVSYLLKGLELKYNLFWFPMRK